MTYKSEEYTKVDRNHMRARSILNWIDTARQFNRLKYAEHASIVAIDRDGSKFEIAISGNLKNAMVLAGVEHCTNAAKTIGAEKAEEIDFDKAAAI